MRKAVTDRITPLKEASGRRYWMRVTPGGPKAPPAEVGGKRPPKTRFLEPYHLSGDHRAALLERLAAAGVGDAESRDLFASAIEYDIANARQAGVQDETLLPPQAAVADPAPEATIAEDKTGLAELAASARSVADHIGGMDETARAALGAALRATDPFQRGYDAGYFVALCTEFRRMAGAAANLPAAGPAADLKPELPPAPPEPPMSASGRRFVRRVARVYEEVLETKASLDPDGPFLATLQLITREAGVPLPRDPDVLSAAILER